jgi:hypothetical protein
VGALPLAADLAQLEHTLHDGDEPVPVLEGRGTQIESRLLELVAALAARLAQG